jgi:hypothetical protein
VELGEISGESIFPPYGRGEWRVGRRSTRVGGASWRYWDREIAVTINSRWCAMGLATDPPE